MADMVVWPIDVRFGCWIWTGPRNRKGYGIIYRDDKNILAHREFCGPIPAGLEPDHLCRDRACVNPTHIEPVTHRENILRGIGFAAREAAQTHCMRGHEFDAVNTYVYNSGRSRGCRACMRVSKRAYKERQRQRKVA